MTDDELKGLFDTMRQESTAAHVKTRHFLALAEEGFRSQVQLIAEKVEELHRESAEIRQEMRTGFAETQAMIKFSHVAVEETLADVQTRLERLESSTH
jgi:uncharacterized protein (UPF0335 family)